MSVLKIVNSIEQMSQLAHAWNYSDEAALVPTMGFLHDGHLELVKEARRHASTVVVSIFVNPLQFGPNEDFEKYPRDAQRDAALLQQAGATILFMPSASAMTPPDTIVAVDPGDMGNVMCGFYRPGHFKGVCTIVAKLFNIVRPGSAIFGWKDAQQFLILKKMVHDLNFPIKMAALETVRDDDGLALSSRNTYLNSAQRSAAPTIYRHLLALRELLLENPDHPLDDAASQYRQRINDSDELEVQYVEFRHMDTLQPLERLVPGKTLIATAVFAGNTRLIDNVRM